MPAAYAMNFIPIVLQFMSLWGIIISKFSFDFWSPGSISGHVCMRFSGLGQCGWEDPPSLWAVPCLRLRSSPEWRWQWAVPRCSVARCRGCLPPWHSYHEGLSLPLMLAWWGYSVIRHLSNASKHCWGAQREWLPSRSNLHGKSFMTRFWSGFMGR